MICGNQKSSRIHRIETSNMMRTRRVSFLSEKCQSADMFCSVGSVLHDWIVSFPVVRAGRGKSIGAPMKRANKLCP